MKKTTEELMQAIEAINARSAWRKGVKEYAIMLLDTLDETQEVTETSLLNGAKDWKQYSYGGMALIYDMDIASTLCTLSELKKTDHGQKRPNSEETWLDVQARALFQACRLILENK